MGSSSKKKERSDRRDRDEEENIRSKKKERKDRRKRDEEEGRARSRSRSAPRTRTTTTTTTTTRRSFSVDSMQLCYFGQIFCAVVLLLAVYMNNGGFGYSPQGYYAYALAVSIVVLIFAFLGLFLYSAMTDTYGRVVGKNVTIAFLITKFLVLWWSIGAFILTFSSNTSLTQASNGYFALWGGVIFAMGALGDGVTGRSSMTAFLGLFTCSIVLITAASPSLKNSGGAMFALILSIITIVLFLMIQYIYQPPQKINSILFYLLAVFWILLPFITTFRGPFLTTGNGYFASWGGALCATIVAGL